MTPEDLIKQTHGQLSAPKVRNHLPLPFQALCYGSNRVTDHTYRHTLADRDPVPFYIFQYTLDGCGAFYHKSTAYDLPTGYAFLTKTPSPSVYQQHPDFNSYHFVFFSMRGEAAMAIIEQIIKRHGNVLNLQKNSKSVKLLCQHIIDLRASNQPFDVYAESLFAYEFLLALWREHSPEEEGLGAEEIPEALERATDYINKNLANPLLDVSDLAKEANLSRCYFTRLFQKFYGTSPRKYLLAQRLNAAMQMLINDHQCHLKEIIDQCGFTSETYFCYAFRKMYRQSPGHFRKRFF